MGNNINLPTVPLLDDFMMIVNSLDFSWGWNDTPLLLLASKCIQYTRSNHPILLHAFWCYFANLWLTSYAWTNIIELPGLIAFYISIYSSGRFPYPLTILHSKLFLYIFIPPLLLSSPWNCPFHSLSIFSILFLQFLCIYLHSIFYFIQFLYTSWFIFET